MVSDTVLNVLRLFLAPKYYTHAETTIELGQLIEQLSNPAHQYSHKERYQLQCLLLACTEALEQARTHADDEKIVSELSSLLDEIEQVTQSLLLTQQTIH